MALKLLSQAYRFIPFKPDIGKSFYEAFTWGDNFLKLGGAMPTETDKEQMTSNTSRYFATQTSWHGYCRVEEGS